MELRAPAKVNWHLAVGRRRSDGYHPIASIFQTCSLCDILEVSISDGPFRADVSGLEHLCTRGKSTLDKAARLWHEETGFDRSICVKVTKNIPSQAGLGGGSSDAATLLLYLNSISGISLPKSELMSLGAKVGCDVPFFISEYRAATVAGLGEKVHEIKAREDLQGFIIITDGEKTSTREAYDALDKRPSIPELDSLDDLERIYRKDISQWTFRNDFDLVNKRPDVEVLEGERLLLTGSGSCHILLTEREKLTLKDGISAIRVSF
ncbi:MAG: hypothetical protein IJG69_02650 [Spirochaetales bacterium]|nr:hypothetical protein [Spirochaetales bacterium]